MVANETLTKHRQVSKHVKRMESTTIVLLKDVEKHKREHKEDGRKRGVNVAREEKKRAWWWRSQQRQSVALEPAARSPSPPAAMAQRTASLRQQRVVVYRDAGWTRPRADAVRRVPTSDTGRLQGTAGRPPRGLEHWRGPTTRHPGGRTN